MRRLKSSELGYGDQSEEINLSKSGVNEEATVALGVANLEKDEQNQMHLLNFDTSTCSWTNVPVVVHQAVLRAHEKCDAQKRLHGELAHDIEGIKSSAKDNQMHCISELDAVKRDIGMLANALVTYGGSRKLRDAAAAVAASTTVDSARLHHVVTLEYKQHEQRVQSGCYHNQYVSPVISRANSRAASPGAPVSSDASSPGVAPSVQMAQELHKDDVLSKSTIENTAPNSSHSMRPSSRNASPMARQDSAVASTAYGSSPMARQDSAVASTAYGSSPMARQDSASALAAQHIASSQLPVSRNSSLQPSASEDAAAAAASVEQLLVSRVPGSEVFSESKPQKDEVDEQFREDRGLNEDKSNLSDEPADEHDDWYDLSHAERAQIVALAKRAEIIENAEASLNSDFKMLSELVMSLQKKSEVAEAMVWKLGETIGSTFNETNLKVLFWRHTLDLMPQWMCSMGAIDDESSESVQSFFRDVVSMPKQAEESLRFELLQQYQELCSKIKELEDEIFEKSSIDTDSENDGSHIGSRRTTMSSASCYSLRSSSAARHRRKSKLDMLTAEVTSHMKAFGRQRSNSLPPIASHHNDASLQCRSLSSADLHRPSVTAVQLGKASCRSESVLTVPQQDVAEMNIVKEEPMEKIVVSLHEMPQRKRSASCSPHGELQTKELHAMGLEGRRTSLSVPGATHKVRAASGRRMSDGAPLQKETFRKAKHHNQRKASLMAIDDRKVASQAIAVSSTTLKTFSCDTSRKASCSVSKKISNYSQTTRGAKKKMQRRALDNVHNDFRMHDESISELNTAVAANRKQLQEQIVALEKFKVLVNRSQEEIRADGKAEHQQLSNLDNKIETYHDRVQRQVSVLEAELSSFEVDKSSQFGDAMKNMHAEFQDVLNGQMKQLEAEAEKINEQIRVVLPRARKSPEASAFTTSEARWFALDARLRECEEQLNAGILKFQGVDVGRAGANGPAPTVPKVKPSTNPRRLALGCSMAPMQSISTSASKSNEIQPSPVEPTQNNNLATKNSEEAQLAASLAQADMEHHNASSEHEQNVCIHGSGSYNRLEDEAPLEHITKMKLPTHGLRDTASEFESSLPLLCEAATSKTSSGFGTTLDMSVGINCSFPGGSGANAAAAAVRRNYFASLVNSTTRGEVEVDQGSMALSAQAWSNGGAGRNTGARPIFANNAGRPCSATHRPASARVKASRLRI